MTDVPVVDRRERSRYELAIDGHTAIAVYVREGDVLTFTHTEVPPELRGHGAGTRLISGALADVRARGLRVVPRCPFVARFIDDHPAVAGLIAR